MATFVRGAVGAACSPRADHGPLAGAQQKITVAWYGGNWGDAFRACVAEPYTQATGVQVSPEVGTSTTTLAKLQQQKAAPTIDVAGWTVASASWPSRRACWTRWTRRPSRT